MAPKKKEHSNDLREIIIKHFLNGDSEREIAQKVLIPRGSVHSMIKKYKSTKCISNIIGRGRKCKTTIHADRAIQRKIKVDRRKSASSVKVELQTELQIAISESTVRRRPYEIGLYGRVARKKTVCQQGKSGQASEIRPNVSGKASWILGQCYLVRRKQVQLIWVRWKGHGLANNKGRAPSEMYRAYCQTWWRKREVLGMYVIVWRR